MFTLSQTKAYIHGLNLPGPVVTSHSGLVAALWLEILLKRPDEFKIEELSSIRNLFQIQGRVEGFAQEPFFAGLGNRDTDTKSYQKVGEGCMLALPIVLQFTHFCPVGIADERIFIVDKRSQVKIGKAHDKLSGYKAVIDNINSHFPRLSEQRNC